MAKKNNSKSMSNGNSNGSGCCGCFCKGGFAIALVLIGVAFALQNSGILFGNVVLWPWILIAIGICAYLFKRKY